LILKKFSIITSIFLTIVLALASITPVSAQEPPPPLLSIEAPESVPVSTEFDISIWITDIEDGFGMIDFGLHVDFNPYDIEYISHEFLDPDSPVSGWGGGGGLGDPGEWGGGAGGYPWTGDRAWFRITFHCLRAGPTEITVSSPITNTGSIILEPLTNDVQYETEPDPVSVTIQQSSPVGGVFYSADKIGLLSPWIAAISIIGCIAITSIIIKKRRA
jgi:hypothetical protein